VDRYREGVRRDVDGSAARNIDTVSRDPASGRAVGATLTSRSSRLDGGVDSQFHDLHDVHSLLSCLVTCSNALALDGAEQVTVSPSGLTTIVIREIYG